MKIELKVGEESRKLQVLRRGEQLRVSFEDGHMVEARVWRADDGTLTLEASGQKLRLRGCQKGPSERQVWLAGRTLGYSRLLAGAPIGARGGDVGGLSATIPALVVDVLVAPGDVVAAGDKLILLESMKMVLPIIAPHAGTVRAVHCAKGDAVSPGVALVELDEGP
jgi:biotin carboxyl carrier protein